MCWDWRRRYCWLSKAPLALAIPDFFQTNDIHEAKDFAMRLAFEETNVVYVQDMKRNERVRDFDAAIYQQN